MIEAAAGRSGAIYALTFSGPVLEPAGKVRRRFQLSGMSWGCCRSFSAATRRLPSTTMLFSSSLRMTYTESPGIQPASAMSRASSANFSCWSSSAMRSPGFEAGRTRRAGRSDRPATARRPEARLVPTGCSQSRARKKARPIENEQASLPGHDSSGSHHSLWSTPSENEAARVPPPGEGEHCRRQRVAVIGVAEFAL